MALAAEKEKTEELEARVNLLEQEVGGEEGEADGSTDQGEKTGVCRSGRKWKRRTYGGTRSVVIPA